MEECSEARELCASGEGKTSAQADANALKSLASIFETQVTASTSSFTSAQSSGVWAQLQESAQVSVREDVKQTLEAAQIIKRFRHNRQFYSLASLDKGRAIANLQERMEKIHAELAALWKRKDRTAWARMWELAHQREALNDRYTILNGERFKFSPSASELQQWYQSRRAEVPKGIELQSLPPELAAVIRARLSNSGYRLFDVSQGERIRATFEAKQEHLNVNGFEKWFFVLNMENISRAGAKTGGLVVQVSTTGRSRTDCESKARATIITEMESKLAELNLKD
jgi:hypothetical protein